MEVEFRLAPSEALQMVYDRSMAMNLTPVFRDGWNEFQRKLDEIAPPTPPMTVPWPTNPVPPAAPQGNAPGRGDQAGEAAADPLPQQLQVEP